jgi:hypothetical protein
MSEDHRIDVPRHEVGNGTGRCHRMLGEEHLNAALAEADETRSIGC